jgi:hypothetical protein
MVDLDRPTYTPEEIAQLHAERHRLLDKKWHTQTTLSRSEVVRLARIRWALDRVEAASK